MSKRKSKSIKSALALSFVLCCLLMSAAARSGVQDLPDGKEAELAKEKCLLCHEADLIVAQRLSREGWKREIVKMIRWGAAVSDAEKEILADYFAARFNPMGRFVIAGPASDEHGRKLFEEKCLLCHEEDIAKQQRLSSQGWMREVEKMNRWGAKVRDEDKQALVDYLYGKFQAR